MTKIETLRAGDFIDLDNWYCEIESIKGKELTPEENIYYSGIIEKFFNLLGMELPKTEQEYIDTFVEYNLQMIEIKNDYEFIYNPPPLPSTTEIKESSIGDEYRQEFAEMYKGYVGITIAICKTFPYQPSEVMEMPAIEFLFWGNFLLHRQFIENIK